MTGLVKAWAVMVLAFFLGFVPHIHAQDNKGWVEIKSSKPSVNLLDRGSAKAGSTTQNKGPMPTATLQLPGAGTSITMVSIGFFPTMIANPGFIGNFFTAPADFPTTYYPFFISGAFAWGTGPPTMVTLGAAVATAPFAAGGTMSFAGFASAGAPGPAAMTSGFFGGKGIFTAAPTVNTGQGCVCGLFSTPGPGPGVGALAFPATPRAARFEFAAPPNDELASATFVLPNVVAAGCYITGATVPVELQSFSID